MNDRKSILDRIAFSNISKLPLPITEIIHADDKRLEAYHGKLDYIMRIDYPVSFNISTKHDGNSVIQMIYEKLGLNEKCHKWIIPYYRVSNWWIEIEVFDVNIDRKAHV